MPKQTPGGEEITRFVPFHLSHEAPALTALSREQAIVTTVASGTVIATAGVRDHPPTGAIDEEMQM